MNKRLCHLVVLGALASVQGFAAKEEVLRFENFVRVGYDDNIDSSAEEKDSGYLTNVSQLTGNFTFSTRSEAVLFWQPEFRYRFDADPEFVSYQDLYGRLDHAISERVSLSLSDRFRYQDKDAQSELGANATDRNYIENDLQGSLAVTLSESGQIKMGAGYKIRVWDDDAYGEDAGNNFDQVRGDASYIRAIGDQMDGIFGVNVVSHEYDGDRGGYDSVAALVGVDQTFSSQLTGYGRVGYQFNDVDNGGRSSDSSSPYLNAGFDYNASERTTVNGALGYSISQSENSVYNAQDRFNIGVGVRHDLTSKINLSAALSYVFSQYDSDYAAVGVGDAEDDFVNLSIRGTYEINRNNFVELGGIFSSRSTDSAFLSDYDRNRVELGWKLKL